jgi:hypothetical protein
MAYIAADDDSYREMTTSYRASCIRTSISIRASSTAPSEFRVQRTYGVKRIDVPLRLNYRGAVDPRSFGSLPAPAESVVELDQREPLVELRLRKIELRREFVVFAGKYLQVTRTAMLVKYFREAIGIFCRRGQ